MPNAKTSLVGKRLYKGVTIFEYRAADGRGHYYMLQAGRSSHKYRTLDGAKRAIDRGTRKKR